MRRARIQGVLSEILPNHEEPVRVARLCVGTYRIRNGYPPPTASITWHAVFHVLKITLWVKNECIRKLPNSIVLMMIMIVIIIMMMIIVTTKRRHLRSLKVAVQGHSLCMYNSNNSSNDNCLQYKGTDSTDRNQSWEAASCAATSEFPNI
jgi:hypothetical protein